MKYNDKKSKQFWQDSSNRKPSYQHFWENDRANRRKRKQQEKPLPKIEHHLFFVMSSKQKKEICGEFIYGTNGKWSTMHHTHDFSGTFDEFIEHLYSINDSRIILLKKKYRDYQIRKLIE